MKSWRNECVELCVARHGLLGEEYAKEAEHQDGKAYWFQFQTLKEVADDVDRYVNVIKSEQPKLKEQYTVNYRWIYAEDFNAYFLVPNTVGMPGMARIEATEEGKWNAWVNDPVAQEDKNGWEVDLGEFFSVGEAQESVNEYVFGQYNGVKPLPQMISPELFTALDMIINDYYDVLMDDDKQPQRVKDEFHKGLKEICRRLQINPESFGTRILND